MCAAKLRQRQAQCEGAHGAPVPATRGLCNSLCYNTHSREEVGPLPIILRPISQHATVARPARYVHTTRVLFVRKKSATMFCPPFNSFSLLSVASFGSVFRFFLW